jgi:hypothetical protein
MDRRKQGISLDRFSNIRVIAIGAFSGIVLGIIYGGLCAFPEATGILIGVLAIRFIVGLVNSHDDPRQQKRPPDAP